MKTAVDTSVILDVVTDDPKWGDASEKALARAFELGSLVINDCVLAEITPALAPHHLERFLSDWRILYLPTSQSVAITAGRMYAVFEAFRSGQACVAGFSNRGTCTRNNRPHIGT